MPDFQNARELMLSTEKLHKHIREEESHQVSIKQYRGELPKRIAELKEYFIQKLDQIQEFCEDQAVQVEHQIDTNVKCLLKANPVNYESCALTSVLEYDLSKSFDNGLDAICQQVKEAFQLTHATSQPSPVNFTWTDELTGQGIEVQDSGKSITKKTMGWSSARINCPLETGNYTWKLQLDGFDGNGDVYLGVARDDIDMNI